jgi:Skp family chaperone for outer membrane proteins
MAEVSTELIYEVLKQVQSDVASFKAGQSELKAEMQAFRGHMISLQTDVHNIYTILDRHDARLERIEKRLELADTTT